MMIRRAMMSLAALSLVATPAVAQSGQLRGASATLSKPVGKRLGGAAVQPARETVSDSSELVGLPVGLLIALSVATAVGLAVAVNAVLKDSSPR